MKRSLKRSFTDFRREWGVLTNFSILGVVILRYIMELPWSFVGLFLLCLFGVRFIAQNELYKWNVNNISLGIEGGLTSAYPRVWSFNLSLTEKFIEQVAARSISTNRAALVVESSDSNYTQFLRHSFRQITIDEYVNRLRIHQWGSTWGGNNRYHWFDIDKSFGSNWKFDKTWGTQLWSFESDTMTGGTLTLSCSWEHETTSKRPYLQLVLWVRHEEESRGTSPNDIIFKLPLEPGRLCDERGELVPVSGQGGKEFKAGDLEMFPFNEDTWESDDKHQPYYKWQLSMQTFHEYEHGCVRL